MSDLGYLGSIKNNFNTFYEFTIIILIITQFPIISNIILPFYKKTRSLFLIIILIIFAIFTPPDIISLLILTIPTIIILEIMVFLKS